MTGIAFHFNVADKLAHSCRLLRKAYLSGAQVVVVAEAHWLEQLDQLLWRFAPAEFVPHCLANAAPHVLAATPVWLAESAAECPRSGVLVNLGQQVPTEFERFERLIEVVAHADADRQAGRTRWKHYLQRGYAMERHDFLSPGEGA